LMPYLMRAALQAHRESLPVMRPMLLEYGADPTCRALDRQYMLGDDLLVAPLFDDARAEYYLPDGQWTHVLTGETRAGGRWYFDEQDFFSVPLWLRENAVLPLGAEHAEVDYDYGRALQLVCGKLGDVTRQLEVFDRDAKLVRRFSVEHRDHTLTVASLDGHADFALQLPWASEVVELQGAEAAPPAAAGIPGPPGGVRVRATRERVTLTWR